MCSSTLISMLLMNVNQVLCTAFSMSGHSKLICPRLWALSRWLMYSWQQAHPLAVGLYRNVRIIWLGSSSRNNKSEEVKLNIYLHFLQVKLLLRIKRRLTPSVTVKHWGGEAGIARFNMHIPCSGAWDTMISFTALISTPGMTHRKVLANLVTNGIKKKVSPQVEVILVDNKRWNKITENQIKFIDVVKEWMHGYVMKNIRKIKKKIGKYLDWPYEEHICTLH